MAHKDNIFTVSLTDSASKARLGKLKLPHGEMQTPAFMPVGTNGTVKAMHHSTVEDIGYRMILGNTYHLYLRPGIEVIKKYGGLHNFSSWKHNILTDSGGFQVFSLAQLRKIKDEGVTFRSHIDGSLHKLSPEKVVDIQRIFGSDILMCLDVCTSPDIQHREAEEALKKTTNWATRSLHQWNSQHEDFDGKLFGIIQGNFFKDLRKRSVEEICSLDFPGFAIGGLSVGEPADKFIEYLAYTSDLMPKDKPKYVMGIGTPEYILEAVTQGIDIFDCVFATRTARNGSVFTNNGIIQIKKARYAMDTSPISENCSCTACTNYSKGYLRHLFKTKEILGAMLATEHNLQFLYDLMNKITYHIKNGDFLDFKKEFLQLYTQK
ncbi:MAG: tRNA guanosine(34) transglycosylase Tgt [Spirochaetia bacterium]|nr:tRNA guanosine(34) transglycosylase Tgt [Spirochaetia bacterium]